MSLTAKMMLLGRSYVVDIGWPVDVMWGMGGRPGGGSHHHTISLRGRMGVGQLFGL